MIQCYVQCCLLDFLKKTIFLIKELYLLSAKNFILSVKDFKNNFKRFLLELEA